MDCGWSSAASSQRLDRERPVFSQQTVLKDDLIGREMRQRRFPFEVFAKSLSHANRARVAWGDEADDGRAIQVSERIVQAGAPGFGCIAAWCKSASDGQRFQDRNTGASVDLALKREPGAIHQRCVLVATALPTSE